MLSSVKFVIVLIYMLTFLLIQLSDFGLAVGNGIQNNKSIKLSGTLGYVAPEYLVDGMSISDYH